MILITITVPPHYHHRHHISRSTTTQPLDDEVLELLREPGIVRELRRGLVDDLLQLLEGSLPGVVGELASGQLNLGDEK